MRIPPLSIKPPNETASEAMRRHLSMLVGIVKALLAACLIQIVVLGIVGVITIYVLNLKTEVAGWIIILSWFLAAYFMKLYARSVFPVNADKFEQV